MILFKNSVLVLFECNYSVLKVLKRNIVFRYEKPEPVTGCTLALKHFDDFYKMLFKKKWNSVRLGLLSPQKQVAVINNFGDINTITEYLQSLGSYNLKTFFEIQKDIPQEKVKLRNKNVEPLENLLEKKREEEKKKEMDVIYSKNKKDDPPKAWFSDKNDEKSFKDIDQKFVYDPEEATTSLSFDFTKAKIDKSRLICPDSNVYEAGLNEFVPATKLRGIEDYVSESEYYKFYQTKCEMEINIEKEFDFNFPENLLAYSFDRGEITEFPSPKISCSGVYEFLLMDGADLLSVLCLGIKKGDAVLNICCKRESIPYCILQTLKTKILVCNELKGLERFINEHFSSFLTNKFVIQDFNFDDPKNLNLYDKILIDADCTDDRASISELENNYFSSKNFKKRFRLPEKQASELEKVLKLIKPGGTVLYTTTTMSPVQNDGVVLTAIQKAWNNYKMEFIVKDFSPALGHTIELFNIKNYLGLKYGTLVVPFLPTNFGPRYISKIVKKI